jgi:hypothetical protein
VKENKEGTAKLAEQAAHWVQALVNALDEAKADSATLARMRPKVQQILECVSCWMTIRDGSNEVEP